MSDHIGEATQKVIDLDALERLADEVLESQKETDLQRMADADQAFYMLSDPATIKALIAELREARVALEPFAAHFVIYEADTPPSTVMPITTEYRHIRRAFLARNGKSDLQKMQNSARNGKGEG
jgi:hypothetical protein